MNTSEEKTKEYIDQYLLQVRKHLTCSAVTKDALMADLRNSLEEFVEENTSATMDDILVFMGEPRKLANELMEQEVSPEEVAQFRRKRRIAVISGIAAAALIVAGLIVLIVVLVNQKATIDADENIKDSTVVYPEVDVTSLPKELQDIYTDALNSTAQ